MSLFYWKRLKPGSHEARRNGKVVATCTRYEDEKGRTCWRLVVLDDTQVASPDGDYVTLGGAKFAYGRAYRLANPS